MAKNKNKNKKPVYELGAISTILGKETEFNGVLTFKKGLQINGRFEGEIESEGSLVIADGAIVNANIKAKNIQISGKITGNVEATEKLEIMETAELYGNIKTRKLHIADGAVFQGNCERLELDNAV